MKKAILKGSILIFVFLISLIVISSVMNRGNTDMTQDLEDATFPLLYVEMNEHLTNCLHGYVNQMDTAYFRDTITTVSLDRSLNLRIDTYGKELPSLRYQVRSMDGDRLIEDTKVKEIIEKDGYGQFEITLKDLIETNKEYSLILIATTSGGEEIYYYTRVVMTEDTFVQEKIDYVMEFNQKSFDISMAADLTKYLESNGKGDNTTLWKVTINSSLKQVTWGDLEPERLSTPVVDVKEIGKDTGSFVVHYLLRVQDGDILHLYQVEEYYRIRYTKDRTYLLEYERSMNELLNENQIAILENRITLGMIDPSTELVENETGDVFAFVNQGNLYSYHLNTNHLVHVYGFYRDHDTDLRNIYQEHDIRILKVDETGNITYLLFGYMNRGKHQGEVGIQIGIYNALLNTTEEQIFIPYEKPYAILEKEMQQLSYISTDQIFYFIMENNFYAVNILDKTYEVIAEGFRDGTYQISDENKMIVWQEQGSEYNSSQLTLMNLSTKKQSLINAEQGTVIAPLGFMGEDLIYGLAKITDIYTDNTGVVQFPMYQLRIQNEAGEILKTYEETDIYVTACIKEENMLRLSRVVKADMEEGYEATTDDQILTMEEQIQQQNKLEIISVEGYQKIARILMKQDKKATTTKILTPKEVLFEGGRETAIDFGQQEESRYYVYKRGRVIGIYSKEATAIQKADENSAVVVNEKGDYVWIKGNRMIKNQIMAFQARAVTESKDSLVVCMEEMLKFEGISRNLEDYRTLGFTAFTCLSEYLPEVSVLDLKGCSLDSVLYYINREIPVLAILEDKTAVLIVGFNELNIVIMDPIKGEVYKKGMNDSKAFFEANGNHFITYIK